jgi:hypothetical protein
MLLGAVGVGSSFLLGLVQAVIKELDRWKCRAHRTVGYGHNRFVIFFLRWGVFPTVPVSSLEPAELWVYDCLHHMCYRTVS